MFAALVVFIGLNIGQGVFLLLLLAGRGLVALGVRLGVFRPKRRMIRDVR